MAEFPDIPGDGDGFARRWSRLKQESRLPEADAPAEEPVAVVDGEATQPFDPDDLPDVDSLDAESDFTPFMREGVPEEVKNLALRKLWRTDSVFANLDGLNDYDEDFNAILKAGQTFMEQLAEAARTATENGTDGPRYPTATYAETDAEADDEEGTEETDGPHLSDAGGGAEEAAQMGEDDNDQTA
jgi:hypothetical protein